MQKVNSNIISDLFKVELVNLNFVQINGENVVINDDELLFNVAGMTPIKHFFKDINTKSENLFSIQKCIRVNDIDEIGDNTHLTSFSMLGFFGFDQLTLSQGIDILIKFLTKFFSYDELYVNIGKNDEFAFNLWSRHNIELRCVEDAENMWFSGTTGPCGIGTEVFCKYKDVELANIVCINSDLNHSLNISKREKYFIDMGSGLERLDMIINKLDSVFDIEEFQQLAIYLNISSKTPTERICLDHFRTIKLISREIQISNHKQGYILKKLARRFLINYTLNLNLNLTVLQKDDPTVQLLISENNKLVKVFKEADDYCNKLEKLDTESVKFLRETIGCPLEYIEKHFIHKML